MNARVLLLVEASHGRFSSTSCAPRGCRLLTPFDGRRRERRYLTRLVDEGRNVVLTGIFGSARTTLVRRLARDDTRWRFAFFQHDESRRAVRESVEKLHLSRAVDGPTNRPLPVLVMDDLIHVTPQRLRLFRELVQEHRCHLIVTSSIQCPTGSSSACAPP